MYNEQEIFEIIQACGSIPEVVKCAQAFSHLIVEYQQDHLQLINELSHRRIRILTNGPTAK